jgi:hypothetical protein
MSGGAVSRAGRRAAVRPVRPAKCDAMDAGMMPAPIAAGAALAASLAAPRAL